MIDSSQTVPTADHCVVALIPFLTSAPTKGADFSFGRAIEHIAEKFQIVMHH